MAHRFLWTLAVAAAVGSVVLAQQAPQPPASAATGTGMVAGRVVDADSRQGIAGATVTLTLSRSGGAAAGLVQTRLSPVLTDSQGRFVFSHLPAGSYFGNAERDGYSSTILSRIIDLAPDAHLMNFNFRMNKLNTVLGTVRDDAGDPVVGTEVVAFTRMTFSMRAPALVVRGRGRTDDRGEYRLNNLPAGNYLICACNRDAIPFDGQLLTTLAARPLDLLSVARRAAVAGSDVASLDATLRTYARTFYPNVQLASRAEYLGLEKGEARTSMDITVATVRAVRVSGQVVGLPPSSINAASMRLTLAGDVPEAAAITQLPPMLVQPDGRFDFSGVPPGTYILDVNTVVGSAANYPSGSALAFLGARGGPPPPPPPPPPARGGRPLEPQEILWASETIVVGDEDVTGLVVGIQRGVNVHGRIEYSGAFAPPPGTPVRGDIQLVAAEVRPMRPAVYSAQIRPDGTFSFVVPPGRYAIPITPAFAPPFTNTRAITAKGVDILHSPLTIDADISDMVITMTEVPPPLLNGTVDLPADEIAEEWSVLIFPSERRLWKEPFGAGRRFLNSRVSAGRTFHPRLPAGDYLLALSHGIPPDWMEASALEELSKIATAVTVADGDKKSVQVKR